VRVATHYAPAPASLTVITAVNMKTVKDYNLPLNSLKDKQQHEKNKHRAILPNLCRHCQSKAKHNRMWAQAMPFLPIKQVGL